MLQVNESRSRRSARREHNVDIADNVDLSSAIQSRQLFLGVRFQVHSLLSKALHFGVLVGQLGGSCISLLLEHENGVTCSLRGVFLLQHRFGGALQQLWVGLQRQKVSGVGAVDGVDGGGDGVGHLGERVVVDGVDGGRDAVGLLQDDGERRVGELGELFFSLSEECVQFEQLVEIGFAHLGVGEGERLVGLEVGSGSAGVGVHLVVLIGVRLGLDFGGGVFGGDGGRCVGGSGFSDVNCPVNGRLGMVGSVGRGRLMMLVVGLDGEHGRPVNVRGGGRGGVGLDGRDEVVNISFHDSLHHVANGGLERRGGNVLGKGVVVAQCGVKVRVGSSVYGMLQDARDVVLQVVQQLRLKVERGLVAQIVLVQGEVEALAGVFGGANGVLLPAGVVGYVAVETGDGVVDGERLVVGVVDEVLGGVGEVEVGGLEGGEGVCPGAQDGGLVASQQVLVGGHERGRCREEGVEEGVELKVGERNNFV